MVALVIILIILAVIGRETPGGSKDPNNLAGFNTTSEILYAGIPVSKLIGASYDEVIDALGTPSYEGATSLEYEGIEVWLHVEYCTVSEIYGYPQFFTINGQTLDKGYDEIIQLLGEPDFENGTRYSNALEYNTANYQMSIFIDWDEAYANYVYFSSSSDNYDYSNMFDLSLVGRWRAYDGGYVEFDEYGNAAISFSPHGSLLIPDYVTWEVFNGQIILTSHFSSTPTYKIRDVGSSSQRLDLSTQSISGSYYFRTEVGTSLAGTWTEIGSGYRTPDALVLLSNGTGTMHRLISSTSMGTVPITWWADGTKLHIEWSLQSAYDYTVSGSMLTIYFSNGSQFYQRVGS